MIQRMQTNQRMSQCVIHNGTITLAGQVAQGASVAAQTQGCLDQIDALLADAGSDRTHLIMATIWLADMGDFDEMNAVWDAWVPEGHAPARACGEARLAKDVFRVEIMITAAVASE